MNNSILYHKTIGFSSAYVVKNAYLTGQTYALHYSRAKSFKSTLFIEFMLVSMVIDTQTMLDIQYVKKHSEELKKNMTHRNLDASLVDHLLEIEAKRVEMRKDIENKNRERNKNAEALQNIHDKKSTEAQQLIEKGKRLKEDLQGLENLYTPLDTEYTQLMYMLPNIYTKDTPIGKDEHENVPIRKVGNIPQFDFHPKEHWELGKELNMIDMERAAKVTGARFAYLKGTLALLEFALIQHCLHTLTNKEIIAEIIKKNKLDLVPTAFIPIVPPVFIRPDVLQKMGRLEPREERYHTQADDLYLIGSAEHTLGSMHMDETFDEASLPLRYLGFSTSFRREAGSYGKDMKGILRVHQFDKLEMETFSMPETSEAEQLLLVAIQEYLMQSLCLPYQVVAICTGDMGTPDARQFDIETWLPGQNKYRETQTSDLMTDYQARRLNIKMKKANGEHVFVHMNDATAFAIGRTIIAIMENYQQKDGSIKIPDVLTPYIPGSSKNVYITAKV